MFERPRGWPALGWFAVMKMMKLLAGFKGTQTVWSFTADFDGKPAARHGRNMDSSKTAAVNVKYVFRASL